MSKCVLLQGGSFTLIAALSATMLLGAADTASAQTRKHTTDVGYNSLGDVSSTAPVFFTINEVLANRASHLATSEDVSAPAVASSNAPTDALPQVPSSSPSTPGPFGLVEFRAPAGELWTKWRKVETDIDHDIAVMDQCRNAPEQCSSRAAARFNALIDAARRHQGRERLASVNAAVNNAISYMTDLEQYGVTDLWSAPLATFTTGHGDCEDYAIAKYVALRQAGVAADDVRLLLVRDRTVHEDHAVVAARQDGRWLILDNRFMLLPEDAEMWNFEPLYAIDQNGVNLLARPYGGSIVANADSDELASSRTKVAAHKHDNGWSGTTTEVRLEAGDLNDATRLAA